MLACDSCSLLQTFVQPFQDTWGLSSIQPLPSFQQLASLKLCDFVRPCAVRRGETLQSIALRERTSELDIRMLNNLLSERALSAYESVFVPVRTAEQLCGKHLRFQRVGAMHRVLPVRTSIDALCTFPTCP